MKVSIYTILCCMMFLQMQAQHHPGKPQKGHLEWKTFPTTKQKNAAQLAQDKSTLQLGADDELLLRSTHEDDLGFRHYRYQQNYKGIPIEGAIYLMHEKSNKVETANGNLIRQLNINTTAAIEEATALQAALQYINATQYAWQDQNHENFLKQTKNNPNATFYPSGELIIINATPYQEQAEYQLAYKFSIYALKPLVGKEVYINAHNGSFITSIENIHTCNDVPASATSNYSGNVAFTACQSGSTYTLKNNIGGGMQVFNANNSNSFPQIPFTSANTFFNDDPTANEVHSATEKTYEYYLNTHGRNSLDDNNMPIHSWVHYGNNFNNAFWNPIFSAMCYGDGDNVKFTSLTSPDIVAHEMTHGVTTFSANLIYEYEPGALNESFSDIFGEMAELHATGNNDWIIGGDFTLQAAGIRNMSNPNDANMETQQPDTYLGNYWYTGIADNGGVHYNSGVQNFWFYLLSQGGNGVNDNGDTYTITGIGKTKAAAIAYRNLTVYLTPYAQYADARTGAIQAAEDLYGTGSNEALQTEAAWLAVGVGTATIDCRTSDSLTLVTLYNATSGPNWTNSWNLAQPMDEWFGVNVNAEGCVLRLTLDQNNLSGQLPPVIGNLGSMERLILNNNPLSGSIPPEIGNAASLEYLWVYSTNLLSGSIPPEIGYLTNLTSLRLNDNQLSGPIPPEIGNLTNLTSLRLSNNQLSGSIPPEIGNLNQLTSLNLGLNDLSGSIPGEIGNLSQLRYLTLSRNELSGPIPPEIGNLNELLNLDLVENELSGALPPELGSLSNLYIFFIYNNQLSGCYDTNLANLCGQIGSSFNTNTLISNGNNFDAPWEDFCATEVGTCPPASCRYTDSLALVALYDATNGASWTNVWDLSLPMGTWYGIALNTEGCVSCIDMDGGFNCVINYDSSGNNLSGSIPVEIGNLGDLTYLNLNYNQLTGNIPSELGSLGNLTVLYLDDNQLTGNIPPEIGNLGNLEYLDLDDNQLSGSIPPEIGSLNNLIGLDLDRNQLSGSIPPEIENLSNLIGLSLTFNQLTGSIPTELGNLNNLTKLYLSNNELSGSIPTELGNLNNLTGLWLKNNQLSGSIPAAIGNLNNMTSLYLGNNQFSGCYNTNLSNLCSQFVNYNISNGNNFDAAWEDFCATGAGSCAPVWPGDFNNDGIAANTDVLYWGLAEGNTGPARANASSNWLAQNAANWSQEIDNINGKHQDGNGDGTVDIQDLQVLIDNYGLTHADAFPTDTDNPLQFELRLTNQTSFNNLRTSTYGLYVESSSGAPVNAHGLAFSLDLSDVPGLSTYSIDTTGSSLHPTATLNVYDVNTGRLDVALTRTDKVSQIISGTMVAECIVIASDVPTGNPYSIDINGGSMMSVNGLLNGIGSASTYNDLAGQFGGAFDFSLSVSVTHEQCNQLGEASVQALEGTAPYTYLWSTGATTAEVTGLISGLYTVIVTDADGDDKSMTIQVNGQTPIFDAAGNILCGSVCPDFLAPDNGIATGLYKADDGLESSGIVPSGNIVDFKAGQIIELKKGFSVQSNAGFSAEIEDCN